MKNTKRILALAGVILLVGLYVITLILAFSDSPKAADWLFASLGATVIVPGFLYIYMWIYKLLKERDED